MTILSQALTRRASMRTSRHSRVLNRDARWKRTPHCFRMRSSNGRGRMATRKGIGIMLNFVASRWLKGPGVPTAAVLAGGLLGFGHFVGCGLDTVTQAIDDAGVGSPPGAGGGGGGLVGNRGGIRQGGAPRGGGEARGGAGG